MSGEDAHRLVIETAGVGLVPAGFRALPSPMSAADARAALGMLRRKAGCR
ncbi:MAG: hypothetical protein H7Y61_03445 [Rhizobiales bacterium]|nr:hypothetical protein [Rhizobacter sp.]